jgi:LysW-gamma-L-lysine carboxypeptidase
LDTNFTVTPRFAVKMLEKALRLYTPSLSEKPMAEFLADKCDDLGFEDIRIDEVGNVIAKKGSGSPKIMLCGCYVDTWMWFQVKSKLEKKEIHFMDVGHQMQKLH